MSKDLSEPAPVTPDPDARPCPKCGHFCGRNHPAVRQGSRVIVGQTVGIVDVGWRCPQCGYEWGFEILTEEPLR